MNDIDVVKDVLISNYTVRYCKVCDLVNLRPYLSSKCLSCKVKNEEHAKSFMDVHGDFLYV